MAWLRLHPLACQWLRCTCYTAAWSALWHVRTVPAALASWAALSALGVALYVATEVSRG